MGPAEVVDRAPAAQRTRSRMDAAAARTNGKGPSTHPAPSEHGPADDATAHAEAEPPAGDDFAHVKACLEEAEDFEQLSIAAKLIGGVADDQQRAQLRKVQNRVARALRGEDA